MTIVNGRAMARVISCRLVTAEGSVWFPVHVTFLCTERHWERVSSEYLGFPPLSSFRWCSTRVLFSYRHCAVLATVGVLKHLNSLGLVLLLWRYFSPFVLFSHSVLYTTQSHSLTAVNRPFVCLKNTPLQIITAASKYEMSSCTGCTTEYWKLLQRPWQLYKNCVIKNM